jgi:NADH:ubiquinone oxidoreductase subunit 2 (subunit N)
MSAGGNQGLLWLVGVALFGSLISLYYYLVVLKVIFLDAAGPELPGTDAGLLPNLTIAVMAAAVLFLGVWPAALVNPIAAALR